MTLLSAKPRWTRLAALPALVVVCGVAGGTLAPTAGAAGLTGSWTTPTANATVSGADVALQFSTNDSTVTFVLPYGNVSATVSGGVASGTFDSTRVVNGTAKLGAMECNALGQCDEVDENVTVSNATVAPTPTPQPPTFSPASGVTVQPGTSILIGGSGSAEVNASYGGSTTDFSQTVTLPYSFVVAPPSSYPAGSYTLGIYVFPSGQYSGRFSSTYPLVIPDTTPPVISKLSFPTSYFPVRDGYRDHFYAILSVNEASTATLVMYKSGKVVSSGTLPVKNTELIDLRAGDRLKPGTYQWQVIVTDTAGNVTRTPMRTVLADRRHTINHKMSVTSAASAITFKDLSGSCSSAKRSGSTVVLASLSKCSAGSDAYPDLALGLFGPALKNAVDYGTVSVTIRYSGKGAYEYYDFDQQQYHGGQLPSSGVKTIKLTDFNIGYPKPIVVIGIAAVAGKRVTVSSFSFNYVYKTLSK